MSTKILVQRQRKSSFVYLQKCSLIQDGSCSKCCWCSDRRKNKGDILVYIDGYGIVCPYDFGINWPIDIDYCPKCKKIDKPCPYYNKSLVEKIKRTPNSREIIDRRNAQRILQKVKYTIMVLRIQKAWDDYWYKPNEEGVSRHAMHGWKIFQEEVLKH